MKMVFYYFLSFYSSHRPIGCQEIDVMGLKNRYRVHLEISILRAGIKKVFSECCPSLYRSVNQDSRINFNRIWYILEPSFDFFDNFKSSAGYRILISSDN